MGYTKIVQFGDLIDIYKYQNNVHRQKKTYFRKNTRRNSLKSIFRSKSSITRTKKNFVRFVYSNVQTKGIPVFCTLTNYQEVNLSLGYDYLRFYIRNLRKNFGQISFIAVPEWQKSGRLHFHCLLWGLPKHVVETERHTRILQRQWARGYLDVRSANDQSIFLALYMAKYMAKAMQDRRILNKRAYSSSYNCAKVLQNGSNTMSHYLSTVLPYDITRLSVYSYETPYLGKCLYQQYKINKYD